MAAPEVSLNEAAQALGVHYMTAYRYVRTGRLPATQRHGEWMIRVADLERFARGARGERPSPRTQTDAGRAGRVGRLIRRLVIGDEPGSWSILEDALVSGLDPVAVHLELVAPAMREVGSMWADGSLRVDEEHRATAVATRLVSRMGPRFTRPGRKRGAVILAGAPDDSHALPISLAADIVRSARFAVIDLGAAVPPESLGALVKETDRLVAVAICVSVSGQERSTRRSVAAVRKANPRVPLLVGGSGIASPSDPLGADAAGTDAPSLLGLLEEIAES